MGIVYILMMKMTLILLNGFFAFCFSLLIFSSEPSSEPSNELGPTELIMVEQGGCYWCKVWDEEVGVIYHKTPIGLKLPLRRVDLFRPLPFDLKFLKGLAFSPTFVVVEKGEEVGRITGYPGESFFWGRLEDIVAKLPNDKFIQTKVR